MIYRDFGRTGWKASALGFGCMRLPNKGKYTDIDEPEAIRMIRHAIDLGVNYVDTAYDYHGGNSEPLVGKALWDGYRDKVKIATKLPPWHVKTAADFDRILNEQFARLRVERIDLYLLHALGKKSWENVNSLGILDWAERAIEGGRIGWLGFSFHDEYPVFKGIVDAYDKWTFCQIQYNYMDTSNQAGTRGLQYSAGKGIAVVAMEPLLGGNLVNPPQPVRSLMNAAAVKRSATEWALQWLWNKPEVGVVLSGMSSLEQVDQNLSSASRSGIGSLTEAEGELVERIADTYRKLQPIPCTRCNYCMPCPHGVSIPHNLWVYNTAVMFNQKERTKKDYSNTKEEERARECTACRECEEKCPQKIVISEWMSRIDTELGA